MTVPLSRARPAQARGRLSNPVHDQIARITLAMRSARTGSSTVDVGRLAIMTIAAQTVMINLMALVLPIVTMAIFDYVARDGAHISLALLGSTGALAVAHEMLLRRSRCEMLSAQSARIVSILASRHFRGFIGGRTLGVSDPFERVASFRELRRLRTILTSALASALLDAPFVALFIGILFVFAGPLGFGALLAIVAHAVAIMTVRPQVRRIVLRGAHEREQLRSALAESASKAASLDEIGMRGAWAARIEDLATGVAMRRERESLAEAVLEAIANLITALAILAVIWLGTRGVMSGTLTVGGAVAAVMLTWRAIAPLEQVLQSTSEVRATLRVALSALRQGKGAEEADLPSLPVTGQVEVRGLKVRFDGETIPALRGISFDIAAGEMVAVCGASGAGKSTLLASLLGLRSVTGGAIVMNGRDLRGADAEQLRLDIGYVPQRPTLFHGTVAQNFRLLAPGADERSMSKALAMAGIQLPHPQLPEGLETRLQSGGGGQIDEVLRMKLMLAAVYAKGARLLLLDDPGANLDRDGDRQLLETLSTLRGETTIIIVTNRPSHMRICDRIIRLDHGMIVTDGRMDQVLAR